MSETRHYKLWDLDFPTHKQYPPLLPPTSVKMRSDVPEKDPYAILSNGGLRLKDQVVIDWLSNEEPIHMRGCQIAAYRGRNWLTWARGGFGRDVSGRFMCAPYITKRSHVVSLVEMLTVGSGYMFRTVEETSTRFRFELSEEQNVSRRFISGDRLLFANGDTILRVYREQGTIDMNLYQPSEVEAGLVLCSNIEYLSMHYHRSAIARLLAEINGFQALPSEKGTFLVLP